MNIQNAILKEIIQSPEYFSKVRNILLENKVFETNNQVIFNIINKFYTDYAKIPNLTEIALQVKEIPNKEQRASIAESLKEIKNSEQINQEFLIDKTLEFVKDQVFTEAMMVGADFIDSKKENLKAKSRELMEKASKISLDFDLGLDYQDIDKRIDYYQNPKSGINYHRFNELAKRLGSGYQKGTLNLFLAPAGVGKSLLISTSITDFLQQGYNILLVSMEMSDFEFVKRIDADNLDLPINDLKNIPKEIIKNKFIEKSKQLGKFYTKQYPAGSFSASMLESLLDLYKSNNIEFDIIFLDYIGIMKSDRVQPSAGLYSYIKAISEEVRAVAVKHNLPICSVSQLNRSAMNKKDSDNSAISDSIGTAQTADFMCFLLQTDEMKEKSELIFKITKNRYTGRTDFFNMKVDYNKMRVSDVVEFNSKEQQLQTETYVNDEIKRIEIESMQNLTDWTFNDTDKE